MSVKELWLWFVYMIVKKTKKIKKKQEKTKKKPKKTTKNICIIKQSGHLVCFECKRAGGVGPDGEPMAMKSLVCIYNCKKNQKKSKKNQKKTKKKTKKTTKNICLIKQSGHLVCFECKRAGGVGPDGEPMVMKSLVCIYDCQKTKKNQKKLFTKKTKQSK